MGSLFRGGVFGGKGGGGGSSSPTPPPTYNPADIVNADINANRYNRSGAFGNRNWTQGSDGRWTVTDTLNPADQANLDASRGLTGNTLDLANRRTQWQLDNNPGGDRILGDIERGVGDMDFSWLGLGDGGGDAFGGRGGMSGYGGFMGMGPTEVNQAETSKVDYSGLPTVDGKLDLSGLNNINTDFSGQSQAVRDALYKKTTGLMDPDFKRQEELARQTLYNQGLVAGSDAYNEELNRLMSQQNQSRERAALDATIAGGQEEARLFQQALAARQQGVGERLSGIDVASKARSQLTGEREREADRSFSQSLANAQLRESGAARNQSAANAAAAGAGAAYAADRNAMTAQRQQDINARLAAAGLDMQRRGQMMGMDQQMWNQMMGATTLGRGGVPGADPFGDPGNINVAGAYGAANQSNIANSGAQQQNYQTQQQEQAARNQMLMQMAMMMFSDKRLKEDIKRVGKTDDGLPVYTYRYKGSPMVQMGVMAQEVEKKTPDAVATFGGFKAVDYGKVS